MFDNKQRFIIENYAKQSPFSSFLPGISGKMGIPIWSFYVNRGQAICSFGMENKDHSIMEFYPAHQSYQYVNNMGFRTFLKVNGAYYEPFHQVKEDCPTKMYVGMNELEIEEVNQTLGIQVNVKYFTLPEEPLGALIRTVEVTNLTENELQVELLDGMAAVIPYGVPLGMVKEMGQTIKAWMQVEDVETRIPYYRVRASVYDSTKVEKIDGGNFYVTTNEQSKKLPAIVDPSVIFEYNNDYSTPIGFKKQSLDKLIATKQVVQNIVPCAFFGESFSLRPKTRRTYYGMAGHAASKDILATFIKKVSEADYFASKYHRAVSLTDELCSVITTKTACDTFDAYCKQTYLDNVLRGGFPTRIGRENVFYMYSRKHGDIERDYNFFSMLPEFYSQGNANYRDVNQNRRCDPLFAPYVKELNIRNFYNLLQLDGYNPLQIQKTTYQLKEDGLSHLLSLVKGNHELITLFFENEFTPGSLLKFIEQEMIQLTVNNEEFLSTVIDNSDCRFNAVFGEGYWTDHWTYNLDLIDTYLALYPEQEEALLFEDTTYTYYEAKAYVNPRCLRYTKTESGIRQYNAINEKEKKSVTHQVVKTNYGKGSTYYSNLFSKMVVMIANKYAALDPYGLGIEMEGGKPGWYDALNGLPALFGSSMAETYEVLRTVEFLLAKLQHYSNDISLFKEGALFIHNLAALSKANSSALSHNSDRFAYWDAVNKEKESYREITRYGVDGEEILISAKTLSDILSCWQKDLINGIQTAIEYGKGIAPTYFYYDLTKYKEEDGVILPEGFRLHCMPAFLEGPVHYLKLSSMALSAKEMYENVKTSNLFDKKLGMYKVNESLLDCSYEIGRCRAFTPGWLENESIWLHMEYKYLLELLRSGLYEEFYHDLKQAAIPFLDEQVYGRSLLENSSFIASSANPDESIHGKGFVARLSGSTAEFVHIWQIMMFGKQPFSYHNGELSLSFAPALPDYLIGESKNVSAMFLGTTMVTYQLPDTDSLIPGCYVITSITLGMDHGDKITVEGDTLNNEYAQKVRKGLIKDIQVTIKRKPAN